MRQEYPTLKRADSGSIDECLALIPITIRRKLRAGFILDANSDLAHRWRGITTQFSREHVVIPASPDQAGTVVSVAVKPGKRAGIWLMPDNQQPGMLEDFLQPLLPENDTCWSYTKEVVDNAKRLNAPFKTIHESKARLHSWLSWQDPPGLPFGNAISKGVLRHDSLAARAFVAWFDRLFS
jgi:hypothetical protein